MNYIAAPLTMESYSQFHENSLAGLVCPCTEQFDDFPAQPSAAAGSPARSTTDSPVKRKRSLSESSSRSSRSRIGSEDDDEERKGRDRMEYADEENVGMVEVTQAIGNVVLPKFPKLASSDGQVSLAFGCARIRNLLKCHLLRRSGL